MVLFLNIFVSCWQNKLSEPIKKFNKKLLVNENIQRDNQLFKNNYIPVPFYKLKFLSSLKVGNDTHKNIITINNPFTALYVT